MSREALSIGPSGASHTVQFSTAGFTDPTHESKWKRATIERVRDEDAEVNKKYRDFWARRRRIVAPGGQLCLSQVKRELFDFAVLMESVAHVYCHVTNGQISNVLTDAKAVCQVADEVDQDEMWEVQKEWVCLDCEKQAHSAEAARQETVDRAVEGR